MTAHDVEAGAAAAGANIPKGDLNGPAVAGAVDFQSKYQEERNKRLKAQGNAQFIDLRQSKQYEKFIGML